MPVCTLRTKPSQTRRALVVDDSQIAQHVLARLLDRAGFDVEVAESAETALSALGNELPDVVFMDHILPGIDGLEAVRSLRAQARTHDLPVIMYTSQEGSEFAARAMLAGADGVFSKSGPRKHLYPILLKLGLISATETPQSNDENDVPIRGNSGRLANTRLGAEPPAPGAVAAAINPMIRAESEKLRHDLLAEFAILERYEERMRRDLFDRVNKLMRASSERIDGIFTNYRRNERGRTNSGIRLTQGLAAAALIASLTAIWLISSVNEMQQQVTEQDRAMLTAVSRQAGILADVRTNLAYMVSPPPAEAGLTTLESRSALPQTASPPVNSANSSNSANSANAATALVRELQTMGIFGRIRVETESGGSFCVSSRNERFALEPGSLSLQQCERVPADFAMASL
jgi:CheY-like chemotaxis protein